MSIVLELAPDTESWLREEAARQQTPVEDYTATLVENVVARPRPRPSNGAELVARLQEEGILGMWADREDLGDSSEFARKLRRQAETRLAAFGKREREPSFTLP